MFGATVQGPEEELEKKPNNKNHEIKYPQNFIPLRYRIHFVFFA